MKWLLAFVLAWCALCPGVARAADVGIPSFTVQHHATVKAKRCILDLGNGKYGVIAPRDCEFVALGIIPPSWQESSAITKPVTWTNGQTLNAPDLNSDFDTIYSWANGNVDSTNISSVNASKVNPGSFAAGAYTFPNGLTVNGGLTLGTALPVAQGGTGVTAFAPSSFVTTTAGGAISSVGMPLPVAQGGTGATTFAGANIAVTNAINGFTASQTTTGSWNAGSSLYGPVGASVAGDIVSTSGKICGGSCFAGSPGDGLFSRSTTTGAITIGGSTQSGILDFGISNANKFSFHNDIVVVGNGFYTSTIQGSSNGSTSSYLPPVYTASGGAVASTAHIVVGTCTFTSSTICPVTLSGAAVYSGQFTYACSAGSSITQMWVTNSSGSSLAINAPSNVSTTVSYACSGT